MTHDEFDQRVIDSRFTGSAETVTACALVLCEGYTIAEAAESEGVAFSTVWRGLKRLGGVATTCDKCGVESWKC